MNLHKKLIAGVGFSLLCVHAAYAQNTAGVYVGAGVGSSSVSSHTVDTDNDPALNVDIGYRFNQNFSAEVFARSLSLRMFDGLVGDSSYYPDTHVGVAVLGTVPLGNDFSLYGRLGIGRTEMKSGRKSKKDYNETDPSLGVGVRYALSPAWSLNVEATHFTKTKVNTYLLGVQYDF